MTAGKPFAFVLMPFDSKFDDIYKLGIKKPCDDLGIVAQRVDEQIFEGSVLERIYRQIEGADFIIADMTGRNANVFYEVGYAHAKEKPCALITQDASDIPFDLKQHNHIIYGGRIVELRDKLSPRLKWMKEKRESARTETIEVKLEVNFPLLIKTEHVHTGRFDLRIGLRNLTSRRSAEIDAIFVSVSKFWTTKLNGKACPYESVGSNVIRYSIVPSFNRLAANGFGEIVVAFERPFWTFFDFGEKRDSYKAKGDLIVEVHTSDDTITEKVPMEVLFEEFPF